MERKRKSSCSGKLTGEILKWKRVKKYRQCGNIVGEKSVWSKTVLNVCREYVLLSENKYKNYESVKRVS